MAKDRTYDVERARRRRGGETTAPASTQFRDEAVEAAHCLFAEGGHVLIVMEPMWAGKW